VLFVEDEANIYEPFSKALAREGFEPVVARTAAKALQLAEDGGFAIVLLDLTLPDGEGRDVCRALRRTSSVPILMLTARGTEADRIVGLELGADDYVVKPFSGAEVIARIRAILRRASGPAEEEAPPGPIAVGDLEVDFASRRVRLAGDELTLSRRENAPGRRSERRTIGDGPMLVDAHWPPPDPDRKRRRPRGLGVPWPLLALAFIGGTLTLPALPAYVCLIASLYCAVESFALLMPHGDGLDHHQQ
jgi:CheY-like chemotaxis protein